MQKFYRCFIVFLVLSWKIGVVHAAGADAGTGQPDPTSRPDEEVFILSVTADRLTLTDFLLTYYDGKDLYVPLRSMAAVLEFPIKVDPERGTATGWYFNEDKTFDLDVGAGEVVLSGKVHRFRPGSVERHEDDLYVKSTEFGRWFSILLKPQIRRLNLEVESRQPLPIVERTERQKRQAKHARRNKEGDSVSAFEPPLDFLEWPFVDVSLLFNTLKSGDSERSQVSQTATVAGVIGDLDAEATYYASDNFDSSNLRVRVGRKSLDGDLLGPLNAHEYAIGDIATPSLPLISDNVVGRGALVSSFGLNELDDRNQITLRGNLAAGWEVELYRNDELLGFQTGDAVGAGRYEFQNVPTVLGQNVFRLVFYGPQGQKRETTESYFISPEMGNPGETSFRIAVNQADKDLIALEPDEYSSVDTGKERLVFQLEQGLSETSTLRTGLVSLSLDGERHTYLSAGLGTSIGGSLVNFDLGYDTDGGVALGGSYQTLINSWSMTARQQFFHDFDSEKSEDLDFGSERIRSYSVLNLFGRVPEGFGLLSKRPVSASLSHRIGEDGNWQSEIYGRISYITPKYSLAAASTSSFGSLIDFDSSLSLIGSTSGRFRWRGEINLDPSDGSVFESSAVFADWTISERTGLSAGVRYSNYEEDVATFSTGLYHRFKALNLGFNVNADTEKDYSLGLSLAFSLGHHPMEQTVEMRGNQFARSGAVSALVFLDRNNDGAFNGEDQPIENASFTGYTTRIKTSEHGAAFIPGLEPYRKTKLELDEETLPDPSWRPAHPAKLMTLRPGVTTELLFPVIETGEVDGWVLSANEADRPLRGVSVWVLNEKGEKIAQTSTAFDGYFFLGDIPLGAYKIALDPEQVAAMGYEAGPAKPFRITTADPFLLDQNVRVSKKRK